MDTPSPSPKYLDVDCPRLKNASHSEKQTKQVKSRVSKRLASALVRKTDALNCPGTDLIQFNGPVISPVVNKRERA